MTLEELYDYYMSLGWTKEGMCLSLTAAQWLVKRAEEIGPDVMADYGSGFSSLVFRWWAAEHATVYSTDHSSHYLNLSKTACVDLGLGTEHFYLHDEMWAQALPPIDLQFVDLDGIYRRLSKSELNRVCNVASPDGVIVYDDWHIDAIRDLLPDKMKFRGFLWAHVPEEAHDKHGCELIEFRRRC